MAITYEWGISGLRKDSQGTVVEVHWTKKGTDENGYSAIFNMVETLSDGDPNSESYIAFDALTESDVVTWIQSRITGTRLMDVDHFINRNIQKQVEKIDSEEGGLPWAPAEIPSNIEQGE